ncbi:MAG TPA: ABC transporter substrate-binding protein [Candidatus Acetatifactor stercoripullorum]|uniref:ABC transporter substrate-binding protein n=1 Tax=Candidatus Acetatifactor stercoripullorum TaxID=2838414 RepID=A0A9D1R403_9FIRM|nr:ABC transporter substrate-binding protein [uncultured Acetatifactor sp.]HIW81276.1 ABC transporter substrate-binding protein [Candidatus Acetatifactor stercoripullorum]
MKKKLISTLLAAAMAASLAACGSDGGATASSASSDTTAQESSQTAEASTEAGTEAETTADSENPLRPDTLDTITVVLFGEESPRMQELMEEEFQQVFIDEINTQVELMYLPWTENGAGGKVDLMIASGQEFDACIVDPAWAANSYSKGYLQDLTDVIDTYLPDWHENMDETAFDAYRFGDGVYAIPIGNKPTAGTFNTVCVRKDIMDAIGMTEITSLEDLTEYVEKAYEEYGLYATYELANSEYIIRGASDRNISELTTGLWVDQDTHELINFAESPEFETAVKLYNEWYEKGLIPKDILTNTVTLPFQANMCSIMRGTSGTTKIENEPGLKTIVPEAETIEFYLRPDKPVYKSTYENTAFQVPVTSKKADRVALFVNLLQKNTELADLFAYGVEGTDYELVDGKVSKISTDELFYEWMIYNVNISTPTTAYTDEFMEVYKTWDEGSITSVDFGFSIDYTNIKTEKAQIDSVWDELAKPMLAGLKDYDSNIEELKTALQNAGWDTYVAEIQRQFDEFLANK